MAFTPITVTRTYETADGVPAEGTVQFKPTAAMVNATTVISAAVAEPLDADGELSITVAANDDPATEPEGVGYTVTEFLAGQPARSYVVVVPAGAPGGTVDLSTLTVLASAPTLQDLSKISEAADFDGTGAAVGQLVAADDASPLHFTLMEYFRVLAGNPDLLIAGTITRDVNGAATAAPVVWPDGRPGQYTATTVSTAFPGAVDAYTITHDGVEADFTYTQPAVTRDSATGAVTARPAITGA